jgi:hypothetical protein
VDLVGWLMGEENLYWITGKAWSGKSTLMKFFLNDNRTTESIGPHSSISCGEILLLELWDNDADVRPRPPQNLTLSSSE